MKNTRKQSEEAELEAEKRERASVVRQNQKFQTFVDAVDKAPGRVRCP